VHVHSTSPPSTGGMNKEERMETAPHNTPHTTADRAASAKKTREDAARKLKAAIKEAAAKAADTGAGSGSVTRYPAVTQPPILPTPPPNRGVSLLSSTEGAVSDAHPLPSPSGRYNSIMINREIKYSQSVLGGGGPGGLTPGLSLSVGTSIPLRISGSFVPPSTRTCRLRSSSRPALRRTILFASHATRVTNFSLGKETRGNGREGANSLC
jgi:hypothetical protein